MGRIARLAAIYPFQLCGAILRGFHDQLKHDGIIQDGTVGMQYVGEENVREPIVVSDSNRSLGGCSAVTGEKGDVLAVAGGYVDDLIGTNLDIAALTNSVSNFVPVKSST